MLVRKSSDLGLLAMRYAYFIVAGFLVVFEAFYLLKGDWIGDFWEHAAVVNELQLSPIYPRNPIIEESAPHAFYSPYLLVVALFGNVVKINSIQALSCFAIFNLFFFLWSLFYFCKKIYDKHATILPALSLLFILFFWGVNAPRWSGFYTFYNLHFVLPYPSTFSMSLCFLIWGMIADGRALNGKNYILLVLLTTIVILTHPTTALLLFIGMALLYVVYLEVSISKILLVSVKLILPVLTLCFFWPYYNFFSLFSNDSADFHKDSYELSQNIWQAFWPSLSSLLLLTFVKKDKLARFFFIGILFMTVIYACGNFMHIYGLSRLLSGVMIFTQIGLAYLVCRLSIFSKQKSKLTLSAVGCLFITSIFLCRLQLYYSIWIYPRSDFQTVTIQERYNFLPSVLNPGDVVLTSLASSLYIPAFGGKVIATIRPLYWVKDLKQRRMAVHTFFASNTEAKTRDSIAALYNVKYLLLDSVNDPAYLQDRKWSTAGNYTIYNKNGLLMLKFRHKFSKDMNRY